ncbi:MAG: PASTA domain-containing protein [Saprospiraceae bacterium]|nr:PASTA domain-containing protein [Saprospiraceae bacterium]
MFWRQLGLIFLFLLGCVLLTMLWLRWYTHHGQSLTLPDYVGQHMNDAVQDARNNSFRILVVDSVFIVGQEGGIIVNQNPVGMSKVKQKRKIYVTLTKYAADQIPVLRLPVLYGKNFDRKKLELKQGFEIDAIVIGSTYDRGPADHILEVRYQGETIVDAKRRLDNVKIEKGGRLEMIVSKSTGGLITVPDLACKSYQEASFQLQTLNLLVSETILDDGVRDAEDGYVREQFPEGGSAIAMGESVTLYLSAQPAAGCIE